MPNNNVHQIKDFYNAIVKDKGLRTLHQFQVQIGNLAGVADFSQYEIFAASANLPGRKLTPENVPFYGFNFNVPTATDYDHEWTLTMRCDREMKVRGLFESWMDVICALKNNTGGGKAQIPNTNVKMHMLNSDMTSIDKTYVMVGVYPTTIGPIAFSHDSTAIATFDLTIMLQYWYDDKETDPLS